MKSFTKIIKAGFILLFGLFLFLFSACGEKTNKDGQTFSKDEVCISLDWGPLTVSSDDDCVKNMMKKAVTFAENMEIGFVAVIVPVIPVIINASLVKVKKPINV